MTRTRVSLPKMSSWASARESGVKMFRPGPAYFVYNLAKHSFSIMTFQLLSNSNDYKELVSC